MPKISKDFPEQLSIASPVGLRDQLTAIAYLMGAGGEYATPARNFLSRSVAEYIAKLSPADRQAFGNILSNVQIKRHTLPG